MINFDIVSLFREQANVNSDVDYFTHNSINQRNGCLLCLYKSDHILSI